MIKIWNIKGELKSEIGTLVRVRVRNGLSESQFSKCIFGKTLARLLGETHEVAPENLSSNLGVQKKDGTLDVPETYESWLERDRQSNQTTYLTKPWWNGIFKV